MTTYIQEHVNALIDGLFTDCPDHGAMLDAIDEALEPYRRPRYTATFTPQAWMRDYAVEVDAEGPTTWDATDAVNGLSEDYRATLLAEIEAEDRALDAHDALKDDPNAPEWVRDWRGPFDIHITVEDR